MVQIKKLLLISSKTKYPGTHFLTMPIKSQTQKDSVYKLTMKLYRGHIRKISLPIKHCSIEFALCNSGVFVVLGRLTILSTPYPYLNDNLKIEELLKSYMLKEMHLYFKNKSQRKPNWRNIQHQK